MIDFNTLYTAFGYYCSLAEKKIGVSLKRQTINSIYNYHRLSIGLNTSGQPTAKQFEVIQREGAEVVINLAPASAENSILNEKGVVEALNMKYLHIPVDFKSPSQKDFDEFVSALDCYSFDQLWIHCAANMRVSAFLYKYRVEALGESKAQAKADLKQIWEPFGVWKTFLNRQSSLNKPVKPL